MTPATGGEKGMTGAERARRHKAKLQQAGLVQVNVWVPVGSVESIQRAAELMRAHPTYEIGRLVDTKTGRLSGLKAKGNTAP